MMTNDANYKSRIHNPHHIRSSNETYDWTVTSDSITNRN